MLKLSLLNEKKNKIELEVEPGKVETFEGTISMALLDARTKQLKSIETTKGLNTKFNDKGEAFVDVSVLGKANQKAVKELMELYLNDDYNEFRNLVGEDSHLYQLVYKNMMKELAEFEKDIEKKDETGK